MRKMISAGLLAFLAVVAQAQEVSVCDGGVLPYRRVGSSDPNARAWTPGGVCAQWWSEAAAGGWDSLQVADGYCVLRRSSDAAIAVDQVIRECLAAEETWGWWSMTDQSRNPFDLTLEGGSRIAGAILLLWGFAFGVRAVIQTVRDSGVGSSTSTFHED